MLVKIFSLVIAGSIGLLAMAVPTPAMAQGTTGNVNATRNGLCPDGYSIGGTAGRSVAKAGQPDRTVCYPDSKNNTISVYQRSSRSAPCAAGYRVDFQADFCTTKAPSKTFSAENNLSKATRLTKPAPGVRCPTGWASAKDLKTCYTTLDNPPSARLKGGKACAAGEMDEWGTWCTGSLAGVTYAHADGHGSKDFNEVYLYRQMNGGDWESMKCCLSPAAQSYYAKSGGAPKAPASADGKGDYTSAEDDEARARQVMGGMGFPSAGSSVSTASPCENGSAAGAALGGAVGGDAGAKLGSMLGGLGKKKKKSGC